MEIDFSQFLVDVQKKANIIVSNVNDVQFLKLEIEISTGISIGFNTLRRLFGFLENRKPSIKTLNTLSKYIGFNSFSHYKANEIKYNDWYFQQYLLKILLVNKITKDDIFIMQSAILNNENIVYLAYFLSFHIQKNNLKILITIFNNVSFETVSHPNIRKLSFILYLSLLGLSEKKSLTLYKRLIGINNFRNHVPLLYIDYTNLNSRYLKILATIEELGDNASDLLFVSLMKFLNQFYREENIIHIDIYFEFKNEEPLYPVLRGRLYGYRIMKSLKTNSELKKQIIDIAKDANTSGFLQEIVPALIIKEEYDFLEKLLDLFYEDMFQSDRWDSKTSSVLYLIALANVNWNNNSIKTAKLNLDLVSLDKIELGYDLYVSLFYYLIKLKISFVENNKAENKYVYALLNENVKITGFKKFIIQGNNYLIK
jgi:hypothetical protein